MLEDVETKAEASPEHRVRDDRKIRMLEVQVVREGVVSFERAVQKVA